MPAEPAGAPPRAACARVTSTRSIDCMRSRRFRRSAGDYRGVREGSSLTRTRATPRLRDPIAELAGFGPQRAAALERIGVTKLADLLRLPPRRHAYFPAPTPLAALEDGVAACLRVRVRRRRGSGRRGIV